MKYMDNLTNLLLYLYLF